MDVEDSIDDKLNKSKNTPLGSQWSLDKSNSISKILNYLKSKEKNKDK
jgi:hypothetical protein